MHVISGPNCQSCPRCGTWNCCEPMLFVRQVSLALRFRCFDSVCSCALYCTWYNRDLQYVDVVSRGCFDLLWVRLLGLIGPPRRSSKFCTCAMRGMGEQTVSNSDRRNNASNILEYWKFENVIALLELNRWVKRTNYNAERGQEK